MSSARISRSSSRSNGSKTSIGESLDSPIATNTEEFVQPDTIPSSIASGAVAAVEEAPNPVSSSAAATAPPTTASTRKPAPTPEPVAFVEKELLVQQAGDAEEEVEREVITAAVPENITSGALQQPTKKQHCNDDNNKGVVIKREESLAHSNKRGEHGSMPIKSEDLSNSDDVYSTKRTRRGKRKRNPSEDNSTEYNDSLKTNHKNNKTTNNQQLNAVATNKSAPKRTSQRHKEPEEEDNTGDETKCCQYCNNPSWESRVFYKCGTVLSKYFPKSHNNPNPGWYKGTIRTHHISSSDSSPHSGSDSDCEYEDEADSSSEEDSEPQCIIYNEILYDDGDTENITQDDLKRQLMDGRKVKILHPTKMATVSNSERHDRVAVVPLETLSDHKFNHKWLEKYNRLKQFQAENGHCRVPNKYDQDPSLGKWVRYQRHVHKNGKLAKDRFKKLDNIGFDWNLGSKASDQAWLEKYDRLIIFKADNGHCRVPSKNYDPDPALGKWVSKQRENRKTGKLAEDRAEKLNKLGFDWDPLDQTWDEIFGRLEQFKTEKGHCIVPKRYDPDPLLGRWVSTQRLNYKKGSLAEDRVDKLMEIGFEWDPRNLLKHKK